MGKPAAPRRAVVAPAGLPADPLVDALPAASGLAPAALLGYQQRWVADRSALKVAEKTRRCGLTWAEASDNALDAARAGGSSTYYICPNQDMGREYIDAVAMWARAYDLAASAIAEGVYDDGPDAPSDRRYIKTFEVRFPATGLRVTALTSRPSNLRGKQGNIVIDEAAFHQDLAELLKAALAMIMWGNSVRVISTHNGAANAFAELIEEVRAGKRGGRANVHRITFADAVADGLYRRVCLRRGRQWTAEGEAAWVREVRDTYGEAAAEELDCIPSQGAGAYLPLALIEARMAPCTVVDDRSPARAAWHPRRPVIVRGAWDEPFGRLPEDVRRYATDGWIAERLAPVLALLSPDEVFAVGGDFGRLVDLSIFVLLGQSRDLVCRPRLVVELSNCPFRSQETILFALCDGVRRRRALALDAGGNGAALAEYAAQRYGSQCVEQVKFSDSYYLQHMPRFKAALQDATLTDLPRDMEHRDDLRALRVIDGTPKLPKAKTQRAGADGARVTRHGDYAIALFLAHRAMQMEAGEIAFTPAPRGGGEFDEREDDWGGTAARVGVRRKAAY
jgi:phage FluMu gp28-like protein